MITLLIGHRGVGKTDLLKRIESYYKQAGFPETLFCDLDEEIVKQTGRSIEGIFAEEGEARFRLYEEAILKKLVENQAKDMVTKNMVIALGAGYMGRLPSEAQVIWIRRVTDDSGRIFLNRPRLNRQQTAFAEYMERKTERDERYLEQADIGLILREGVENFDRGEFEFFTGRFQKLSGYFTLSPQMKASVLDLPAEKFEVRDDLVEAVHLPVLETRTLFSKRLKNGWIESPDDWPLELGEPPGAPSIVSLHERLERETLPDQLKRLEKFGGGRILKAAPLIESFDELLVGYRWQQEEPWKRAFLPRSENGRWKWFRLFMKGKMPVNFWRIDNGSAADQPTLLEWLNHPAEASEFAAVLGDPLGHSRTPVEQQEFFAGYGWPVYAIQIYEDEWQEAFAVLQKLGLRAAAVTSPLKHQAFLSATVKTLEAEDLQAVNTLYIDDQSVIGHNTDLYGFQQMVKDEKLEEPVAVWGGGGTLSVIFKVFENAVSFSARSGQSRVKRDVSKFKPQTLIWACGRDPAYKWPLHDWELQTVVDMNYAENSMGKELAQALGCRYISGLSMFKHQAEAQRKYWRSLMEGRTS